MWERVVSNERDAHCDHGDRGVHDNYGEQDDHAFSLHFRSDVNRGAAACSWVNSLHHQLENWERKYFVDRRLWSHFLSEAAQTFSHSFTSRHTQSFWHSGKTQIYVNLQNNDKTNNIYDISDISGDKPTQLTCDDHNSSSKLYGHFMTSLFLLHSCSGTAATLKSWFTKLAKAVTIFPKTMTSLTTILTGFMIFDNYNGNLSQIKQCLVKYDEMVIWNGDHNSFPICRDIIIIIPTFIIIALSPWNPDKKHGIFLPDFTF